VSLVEGEECLIEKVWGDVDQEVVFPIDGRVWELQEVVVCEVLGLL
jgi:hypothetical protein